MRAKLTVVGGKASMRSIKLRLPARIGRSREANMTVAHPQVSRKHCELLESDGLIVIRDLGSLNGTYVGTQRIKEAPLLPESTFSIGPLTFCIHYQLEGDPDPLPETIVDDRPAAADANISQTHPLKPPSIGTNAVDGADSAVDDPALDDFLKGIS